MGPKKKDTCNGQHQIKSNGSLSHPAAAFNAVDTPTKFAIILKVCAYTTAKALREVQAGMTKVSNCFNSSRKAKFPQACAER